MAMPLAFISVPSNVPIVVRSLFSLFLLLMTVFFAPSQFLPFRLSPYFTAAKGAGVTNVGTVSVRAIRAVLQWGAA